MAKGRSLSSGSPEGACLELCISSGAADEGLHVDKAGPGMNNGENQVSQN